MGVDSDLGAGVDSDLGAGADAGAAIKKLLKIFLFIFLIYY